MELLRYTIKINHSISGGLGKLLNYFIKHNPELNTIISYSDNRFSAGGIYKALNFHMLSSGAPSYFYFINNTYKRYHRFTYTKRVALKLYGGNIKKDTEWDIMLRNGWNRIWDCGSSTWILKLK
jgi:hypothetical protein